MHDCKHSNKRIPGRKCYVPVHLLTPLVVILFQVANAGPAISQLTGHGLLVFYSCNVYGTRTNSLCESANVCHGEWWTNYARLRCRTSGLRLYDEPNLNLNTFFVHCSPTPFTLSAFQCYMRSVLPSLALCRRCAARILPKPRALRLIAHSSRASSSVGSHSPQLRANQKIDPSDESSAVHATGAPAPHGELAKAAAWRPASFTPDPFLRRLKSHLLFYLQNPNWRNEKQLLNAWKKYLWEWGGLEPRPRLSGISALDWSFLPHVDGASFYNTSSDGRSVSHGPWRVRSALPQLAKLSTEVFTAFLGTFCALMMESPTRPSLMRHWPFLYLAASISYRASTVKSQELLSEMKRDIPSDRWHQFSSILEHAHHHATIVLAYRKLQSNGLDESNWADTVTEALERNYVARIERLTIGVQPMKLEALWRDAHETFRAFNITWLSESDRKDTQAPTKLTSRIYLSFMRVGFLLGHSSFANKAWNEMISYGLKPDLRHFTTAIKGAGTLKDAAQVEKLWQLITSSGIDTDDKVWAARIGATIQAGNFEKGLTLLEDMGKSWSSFAEVSGKGRAGQHDTGHAPSKPTIATLNVALLALSAQDPPNIARMQRLLNWASNLGIRSDIISCNIFLSMFARLGHFQSAIDLLKQMRSSGVIPDKFTYSSLIYALLASDRISSKERTAIALVFMKMMESQALTPNDHILSALLKGSLSGSLEPPIGQAVLSYAGSHGSIVYGRVATALLEHYIDSPAVDINSLQSLWNHVNNANLQVDAYFFNRMVQGFATLGQLDLMTFFLIRMVKTGMPPTWSTLLAALSVSLGKDDGQIAQVVVEQADKAIHGDRLLLSQQHSPEDDQKRKLFYSLARRYGFDIEQFPNSAIHHTEKPANSTTSARAPKTAAANSSGATAPISVASLDIACLRKTTEAATSPVRLVKKTNSAPAPIPLRKISPSPLRLKLMATDS
jgi:pentatricopeptide repeat protein